jgi:hypothetical protein
VFAIWTTSLNLVHQLGSVLSVLRCMLVSPLVIISFQEASMRPINRGKEVSAWSFWSRAEIGEAKRCRMLYESDCRDYSADLSETAFRRRETCV